MNVASAGMLVSVVCPRLIHECMPNHSTHYRANQMTDDNIYTCMQRILWNYPIHRGKGMLLVTLVMNKTSCWYLLLPEVPHAHALTAYLWQASLS